MIVLCVILCKFRLVKLCLVFNWLNVVFISEWWVFFFCCVFMFIMMFEFLLKVLLVLYQRMNILDCFSIVNEW